MKAICLIINIVGGLCVLATYAYNLWQHSESSSLLWGGVPVGLRPWYGVGMLFAMLGYLTTAYVVFFEVNTAHPKIANGNAYLVLSIVYVFILVPSALWMPFTFKMLMTPSESTWVLIRSVLFVVAFAALALIIAVGLMKTTIAPLPWTLALIGSTLFFLHVFVLDALIWPHFFR